MVAFRKYPPWLFLVGCLALASLAEPWEGLGQSPPAFSHPARDWRAHPSIQEINETPPDLYALGDVHGDYERLVNLLVVAQIMPAKPAHPKEGRWSAGKAVLVCTGDFIDKGDQSLEVIGLFQALQREAVRAGGQLVVTMGNHEAAFLVDPANRKAVKFFAELQQLKMDPKLILAGKDDQGLGKFLGSLPLAARVGDWFFAHAGCTRNRSLQQLRGELQEGIDAHGYDIDLVAALFDLVESRFSPMPWWEITGDVPAASTKRLAAYANALGVKHLVVGHRPNAIQFSDGTKRPKGTMMQKFNGLIFLIDVGMSRGIVDGPYSNGVLLHVHNGREATALHANGKKEKLWP